MSTKEMRNNSVNYYGKSPGYIVGLQGGENMYVIDHLSKKEEGIWVYAYILPYNWKKFFNMFLNDHLQEAGRGKRNRH